MRHDGPASKKRQSLGANSTKFKTLSTATLSCWPILPSEANLSSNLRLEIFFAADRENFLLHFPRRSLHSLRTGVKTRAANEKSLRPPGRGRKFRGEIFAGKTFFDRLPIAAMR
jgi:hypothetical protein